MHNHQITPPIDRVELLKAVDEGLNEFLSTEKNCLPTNSRIAADLHNARNNLKTTRAGLIAGKPAPTGSPPAL
ncbi:hypothetical protein AAZU54_25995 [Pseudomonas sp. Je.1.5.c]|uniref:hypothetical protein n=1 Tax=Pseudomonas TaxID=286 RepID=UPI0034D3CD25